VVDCYNEETALVGRAMNRAKRSLVIALVSAASILCTSSHMDAGILVVTKISSITNCYDAKIYFYHGERREGYYLQAPSPPDNQHCDFKILPAFDSWPVPWAVSEQDFINQHYILVRLTRIGPHPGQEHPVYWIYQSDESDGDRIRYSTDGHWHPHGTHMVTAGSEATGGYKDLFYEDLLPPPARYWQFLIKCNGSCNYQFKEKIKLRVTPLLIHTPWSD
jgi:hypothetical protein